MSQPNVFEAIKLHYGTLSKTHRRIADFLTKHYDQAVFMTAKKLADQLLTSESTVVRFAFAIGFDGYPDLQENLRDSIKNILTTRQKLTTKIEPESFEGNIKASFTRDMSDIRTTFEHLDLEELHRVAITLKESKRIFILGQRSSKVLVDYLSFYLNFLHSDVHALHNGAQDIFDQIVNLRAGDTVFVISFPRYSKATLSYAEIVKKMGIPIVAMTDTSDSPITKIADKSILATYSIESFIDSHVAPMALINALVTAMAYDNLEVATAKFQELEEIWDDYEVYV